MKRWKVERDGESSTRFQLIDNQSKVLNPTAVFNDQALADLVARLLNEDIENE